MTNLTVDQWVWYGTPGHFIYADQCKFHMCTKVGKYLVSTVGEYFPHHRLKDDDWKIEHMFGDEIGVGRLYETTVFKITGKCEYEPCGCEIPIHNGDELGCIGANKAGDAAENHRTSCLEFQELQNKDMNKNLESNLLKGE